MAKFLCDIFEVPFTRVRYQVRGKIGRSNAGARRHLIAGSNGETDVINFHGRFVWYELITTDMQSAKIFYSRVMNWVYWTPRCPVGRIIVYCWKRLGRQAHGPNEGSEGNGRKAGVGWLR
jgi:hypothetical protein